MSTSRSTAAHLRAVHLHFTDPRVIDVIVRDSKLRWLRA
jgi:hypothetical protein